MNFNENGAGVGSVGYLTDVVEMGADDEGFLADEVAVDVAVEALPLFHDVDGQ